MHESSVLGFEFREQEQEAVADILAALRSAYAMGLERAARECDERAKQYAETGNSHDEGGNEIAADRCGFAAVVLRARAIVIRALKEQP